MKPMKRREFIKTVAGTAAGLMGISSLKLSPAYGRIVLKKPVNLLYVMTDQQRWDALSRAGNTVLATPNLDKFAGEGVYFENAYSPCPVCVPSRTSALTGYTIEKTQVRTNPDMTLDEAVCPQPSWDDILADTGYRTEYYGKFHSPIQLGYNYKNMVTAAGRHSTILGIGMKMQYDEYLDKYVPKRALLEGEQYEGKFDRPYVPNPFDQRYGLPPGEPAPSGDQEFGRLEIPAEYARTGMYFRNTMDALERCKNGPFSIFCSIPPPHPPFVPTNPYHDNFNPAAMPIPGSISDPMTNSPYSPHGEAKWGDAGLIGYMIANYYALCQEIDIWFGELMAKLDQLGLSDNTLVIFTSDHGEMAGSHRKGGKANFYEESAHIPLMIRLPGVIPVGKVVSDPVSQIDLFATILDYLDVPGTHPNQGSSLQPVVDGSQTRTYCCSEWNSDTFPGFMVRTLGWKFMFGRKVSSSSLDALYDLSADPLEMNNLLGSNPDKPNWLAKAEEMKAHLVEWLTAIDSPYLQSVKDRAI